MQSFTLPIGTVIKIGINNNDSTPRARELVFRTTEEATMDSNRKSLAFCDGVVLDNPNGWHSTEIAHIIDLNYDSIIEGESNKLFKDKLETFYS